MIQAINNRLRSKVNSQRRFSRSASSPISAHEAFQKKKTNRASHSINGSKEDVVIPSVKFMKPNESVEIENAAVVMNNLRRISSQWKSSDEFGISNLESYQALPDSKVSCALCINSLHPHGSRRFLWDIVVSIMTIVSVFTITFYVGFDIYPTADILALDLIIDSIYLIDIFVKFNTAFHDDSGELVMNARDIAKHYLKNEFLLDACSIIPVDYFSTYLVLSVDPLILRTNRIIKLIRLVRLSRLIRLVRFPGVIERLMESDALAVHPSFISLVIMFLVVFAIGHVTACIFHWLTTLSRPSEATWTDVYIITYPQVHWTDVSSKYMASLYWAFTTISTVGYGDITPATSRERIFASIVVLIGASVFGYIVGNMNQVMESFDLRATLYNEKINYVKEYVRSRNVHLGLAKRIVDHYRYFYSKTSVFDTSDLFTRLPTEAYISLLMVQHGDVISEFPFMRKSNKIFVTEMVSRMKPFNLSAGEILYCEGDTPSQMYFVRHGEISLLLMVKIRVLSSENPGDSSQKTTMININNVDDGNFFGESSLLLDTNQQCTAYANVFSELYFLSRQDLILLLEDWPVVKSSLLKTANNFSDHVQKTKILYENKHRHRSFNDRKGGRSLASPIKVHRRNLTSLEELRSHSSKYSEGKDDLMDPYMELKDEHQDNESPNNDTVRYENDTMIIPVCNHDENSHHHSRIGNDDVDNYVEDYEDEEAESDDNLRRELEGNEGYMLEGNVADRIVNNSFIRSRRQSRSYNTIILENTDRNNNNEEEQLVTNNASNNKDSDNNMQIEGVGNGNLLGRHDSNEGLNYVHETVQMSVSNSRKNLYLKSTESNDVISYEDERKLSSEELDYVHSEENVHLRNQPLPTNRDRKNHDGSIHLTISVVPPLTFDSLETFDDSIEHPVKPQLHSNISYSNSSTLRHIRECVEHNLIDQIEVDDKGTKVAVRDLCECDHSPPSLADAVDIIRLNDQRRNSWTPGKLTDFLHSKYDHNVVLSLLGGDNDASDNGDRVLDPPNISITPGQSNTNVLDIAPKLSDKQIPVLEGTISASRITSAELWWKYYLIHPENNWKLVWNIFISAAIVYSVLYETYIFAFQVKSQDDIEDLNWVITALFGLDILISFRTSYIDEKHSISTSGMDIAVKYMKGWFLIDFLSTIPFDTLVSSMASTSGESSVGITRILKIFRLLRLVKVGRIVKVSEFFDDSCDALLISPSALRIAKLLSGMLFVAHLVACIWYYIAVTAPDSDTTWMSRYCTALSAIAVLENTGSYGSFPGNATSSHCELPFSTPELYVLSLYWTLVTMCTVGYGDITPYPLSVRETATTIIVIVLGSVLTGYIIGSASFAIANFSVAKKLHRIQLDDFKAFVREAGVPPAMSFAIKQHLKYQNDFSGVLNNHEVCHSSFTFFCNNTIVILFVHRCSQIFQSI